MERWTIYVDILGFSNLYKNNPRETLRSLGELIEIIWYIGRDIYPNSSDRLFIHQYGDGIAITSEFLDEKLTRPIYISIFLMQYMLNKNCLLQIGIAQGEFTDILNCYPAAVIKEAEDISCQFGSIGGLRVGAGIMNFQQIMGLSFISAVELSNNGSGLSLRLEETFVDTVEDDQFNWRRNKGAVEINWLCQYKEVMSIYENLKLEIPNREDLISYLNKYIQCYRLKRKWTSTQRFLLN